jgi:hypothetical protein
MKLKSTMTQHFKLLINPPGPVFKSLFALCLWLTSEGVGQAQTENTPTVRLETGNLKAVFVDNQAFGEHHRQGYSGIAELYHQDQDSTLFVPFFAGFNLEHIFGGDSLEWLFEPRRDPMTIQRISKAEVMLHQPNTSISKVESWTTFKMVPPHYIDVEFKFKAHEKSIFQHGYIGFFWASYINSPQDFGIFIKGKSKRMDQDRWIRTYSEKHGLNSTHVGVKDTLKLFMSSNFNIVLANHFSDYTFTDPFYYGRFHNMVFAYLFPETEEGVFRFTQSPSGGGGNPAWDFQYILPGFEVGKEYSFECRMIYKEWIDQNDLEGEYQFWKKNKE